MENKNEPREMTQEELDKIVGGYEPAQSRMQQQQYAGILCPTCGNPIPISIHQILLLRNLHCPACGISLFIDKKKSDKALEILAKIEDAARFPGN